jgi:hypothetical protein
VRKFNTALSSTLACGWLLSATAQADISCSGTLSSVLLYADGTVMINSTWRNDWTMICNTQNGYGGIDISTCLAWYGAAVKASQSHVAVATYYAGNTYTCANLPTYGSTPPTVYLMTNGT